MEPPELIDPPAFVSLTGEPGSADGQFNKPLGIAVDLQGCLYTADTFNHRIQVFSYSTTDAENQLFADVGVFNLDAFPNPFNPQTTISFELPKEMAISLCVYDISGRMVNVLVDSQIAYQGRNEVVWRGRDKRGLQCPSGTYFYRLEAGGYSETKRMTLLK